MTVPIHILIFALKEKKVNQLKLYLFLKTISSGHILLSDEAIRYVCDSLKWKDKRTFKNNIEWLLNNHWTALNNKTQSLRIASFEQVFKKTKGNIYTAARMEMKDFKTFRPFIYAAIITWGIKQIARKHRKPERNKGNSNKSRFQDDLHILPNEYSAKLFKLDSSTASRYKNAAADAEYLNVYHRFINLNRKPKDLANLKLYFDNDIANSLVIHKGQIHEQQADAIYSSIQLVSLKRLRLKHKK